jgi:methylphosphotriester-DNA--protein-cysteine methyltransferase
MSSSEASQAISEPVWLTTAPLSRFHGSGGGIGKAHVPPPVRESTGMTPIEYCRAIRIARARELLEFGNTPQKEIAHSLRYKDVASFARVFRKATGLAPGAYRKRFALVA